MLKIGDSVALELGGSAKILSVLGSGGQGTVYKAEFGGKEYALKMYFANKLRSPELFPENLSRLTEDRIDDAFVMPLYLTEKIDGSFGFLMELVPEEYKPFSDVLNARVKLSGLYSVVNSAIKITSAFRALHNSGKSYQDLNDGGFFIRPTDGDVLICD